MLQGTSQGIESDQFGVKKKMSKIDGSQSLNTARRIIAGFEAMLSCAIIVAAMTTILPGSLQKNRPMILPAVNDNDQIGVLSFSWPERNWINLTHRSENQAIASRKTFSWKYRSCPSP